MVDAHHAKIGDALVLAKSTVLTFPSGERLETPLLLPSYSSKGVSNLTKLMTLLAEYINGPILVSAYDIHYSKLRQVKSSSQVMFIDSGGYECTLGGDFFDPDIAFHHPAKWTEELYREAVSKAIDKKQPRVVISFDHPLQRHPISKQIRNARSEFDALRKKGAFLTEFLVKPESRSISKQIINADKLIANIKELAAFDIVGMAEKELGATIIERMVAIARVRRALNENGLNQPIHVFGSLDPVLSPLYYMSGAEIFDGLTWLRYGFRNGQVLYHPNFWALDLDPDLPEYMAKLHAAARNFGELKKIQMEMKNFESSHGDFTKFAVHGGYFKTLHDTLAARVKGVI